MLDETVFEVMAAIPAVQAVRERVVVVVEVPVHAPEARAEFEEKTTQLLRVRDAFVKLVVVAFMNMNPTAAVVDIVPAAAMVLAVVVRVPFETQALPDEVYAVQAGSVPKVVATVVAASAVAFHVHVM